MMKNYQFLIKTVITWVALCMSCLAMAMSTPPLSANDAFTFSTYQDASGQWLAEWQIAPQHYLYRDRLRITVLPPETAQLKII